MDEKILIILAFAIAFGMGALGFAGGYFLRDSFAKRELRFLIKSGACESR